MLYRIAICDDVTEDASYIESLVREWAAASGNVVNVDIFPSAEAFWFQYEVNQSFDILMLDVEMGAMNGVELAKRVRSGNEDVQIVFITGFPDYIAEGYEVSALHYLMKPVFQDKIGEVLDKAVRNLRRNERSLMVLQNGAMLRLPVSGVFYVEAFAHTTRVVTQESSYDLQKSITEMEKMLVGDFVRCHRSYLVNLSHIRKITKSAVLLDDGQELPLSRSQYQRVNQEFIAYFTKGSSDWRV